MSSDTLAWKKTRRVYARIRRENILHEVRVYFVECYWRSGKIKREMSLGQVTKGFLMLLIIAVSVKQGGLHEDFLE